MKKVIGFIQIKKINLPSGESIHFGSAIQQFIGEVRELYQDAFKKNITDKEKEYYAYYTALLLVCGHPGLKAAIQLVKQEFESLFTTYYIEKCRNYIAPYIEALLPENP
ncbi:hypothetical protein QUB56_29055 [Microcoleus sp. AR_TQ3_B6]|uniref:hypothetical protein n=1 Tax=Microcoleus sp. AR_TQ3_B6 TaxID=3055284 RepID=UPI002FD67C1C